MVFSDNHLFDQLRQDAATTDQEVEVEGVIAGFDGPYPVVSIRSYRLEQMTKAQQDKSAKDSSAKGISSESSGETPEGKDNQ